MKQELNVDYDISVDNMLPINEPVGSFVVNESSFIGNDNKLTHMNVLQDGDKQIFAMKDGTFVLEECDDDGCNYFFSKDINDLL